MIEMACPGWPASWVNAWLAAVGATVLDERIRLRWTTDGEPTAVLSSDAVDPVDALVESWPDAALLADLPIEEHWQGAGKLQRKVPAEAFGARARAARGHSGSWTLSSTLTDLCVDEAGDVAHAPFDPAGPGTVKWLHHRLVKVHKAVEPSAAPIQNSLLGQADRVKDNGLGFDLTRLGSLSDDSEKWVDPVVEVFAFFGLALLPVRGQGVDRRLNRNADAAAHQRGWRQLEAGRAVRAFHWPAWRQPLDRDGIDALLDVWNPERKDMWPRVGVHAAWQSVPFGRRGPADSTRAFGGVRL